VSGMQDIDRTCWKGIELEHPADWEMTRASLGDDPASCAFADRRYERLKLQWRALKYVPDLKDVIERRRQEDQDGESSDWRTERLSGAASGWQALVRRFEGGHVVHAGRFFDDARILMQAILVWPGKRDRALESRVLASVRPAGDRPAGSREWRAMGIRMQIASEFELLDYSADAGRIGWTFGGGKRRARLRVERIAMPRYWLKSPLRDWLSARVEPDYRWISAGEAAVNGHTGARVISRGRLRAARVFGRGRPLGVDVAWKCPVEERVYHVRYRDMASGRETVALPDHVSVECCHEVGSPRAERAANVAGGAVRQ